MGRERGRGGAAAAMFITRRAHVSSRPARNNFAANSLTSSSSSSRNDSGGGGGDWRVRRYMGERWARQWRMSRAHVLALLAAELGHSLFGSAPRIVTWLAASFARGRSPYGAWPRAAGAPRTLEALAARLLVDVGAPPRLHVRGSTLRLFGGIVTLGFDRLLTRELAIIVFFLMHRRHTFRSFRRNTATTATAAAAATRRVQPCQRLGHYFGFRFVHALDVEHATRRDAVRRLLACAAASPPDAAVSAAEATPARAASAPPLLLAAATERHPLFQRRNSVPSTGAVTTETLLTPTLAPDRARSPPPHGQARDCDWHETARVAFERAYQRQQCRRTARAAVRPRRPRPPPPR
jgi:hypothetical protein